jgi:hypothetical protein
MMECFLLRTLSGEIAYDAGGDTKHDATPWSDETRGRSSSNETRDSAGTPAYH